MQFLSFQFKLQEKAHEHIHKDLFCYLEMKLWLHLIQWAICH